jgi:TIR domain
VAGQVQVVQMGLKVFLSYRRGDSSAYAGWLHSVLLGRHGIDHVFRDLDAINPGDDWQRRLYDDLKQADLMVVLIGPHWVGADGRTTLATEEDWVHREVRAAIDRDLPLFPVLVGGAVPPRREQLPHDITSLLNFQAVSLRDDRFDEDATDLARRFAARLESGTTQQPNAVHTFNFVELHDFASRSINADFAIRSRARLERLAEMLMAGEQLTHLGLYAIDDAVFKTAGFKCDFGWGHVFDGTPIALVTDRRMLVVDRDRFAAVVAFSEIVDVALRKGWATTRVTLTLLDQTLTMSPWRASDAEELYGYLKVKVSPRTRRG